MDAIFGGWIRAGSLQPRPAKAGASSKMLKPKATTVRARKLCNGRREAKSLATCNGDSESSSQASSQTASCSKLVLVVSALVRSSVEEEDSVS